MRSGPFSESLLALIWSSLPVLAVCFVLDTGAAQETQGSDKAMQALVLDGIQNNMRLLESFELVVTVKEKHDLPPPTVAGGPGDVVVMQQDRTVLLHIWHDGKQWRQDLETTILSGATVEEIARKKETVPHSAKMVFDGEKTLIHRKYDNVGVIRAGKAMERDPDKDLKYGYSVWGIHLLTDIQRATRIELMPGNTGLDFVEVDFEMPGEGTVTMTLNAQRGFMIEQAKAINTAGQLVGERQATGFKKVQNGACLLMGIREQTFVFAGDKRRTTSSITMTTEPVSINEPIDPDIFKVEFPPRTRVTNEITGNKYRVPGDPVTATPDAKPSRVFWVVANLVVLAVIASIVYFRVKRKAPPNSS